MNNQPFHYNNYGFPLQLYPNPPNFPDPLYPHRLNYSYHQLQQKYEALHLEHQELLGRYHQLQQLLENLPQKRVHKTKIKRRSQTQLDKSHHCPYLNCHRDYASEFALNLHIKAKHHGGNKKQRDRAAKIIIKCQAEGLQPPHQQINLPPGYIEQNRIRIMLMDSAELTPVPVCLKQEE